MLNILVVSQNLFFLPRIANVAAPYSYEVKQARSELRFWAEYAAETTALVLVDLAGDRDTWTGVVSRLVDEGTPRPKIVAFGPHSDVAVLHLATDLGCDRVLTRGEFSASLSQLIESRGANLRN